MIGRYQHGVKVSIGRDNRSEIIEDGETVLAILLRAKITLDYTFKYTKRVIWYAVQTPVKSFEYVFGDVILRIVCEDICGSMSARTSDELLEN